MVTPPPPSERPSLGLVSVHWGGVKPYAQWVTFEEGGVDCTPAAGLNREAGIDKPCGGEGNLPRIHRIREEEGPTQCLSIDLCDLFIFL